jgi:hypothetical protein
VLLDASFLLGVADGINALAVGVSFAFQMYPFCPPFLFIGLTTFCFFVAGVKIETGSVPDSNPNGTNWRYDLDSHGNIHSAGTYGMTLRKRRRTMATAWRAPGCWH